MKCRTDSGEPEGDAPELATDPDKVFSCVSLSTLRAFPKRTQRVWI
jgi:hypothetical protein